MTTLPFSFHRQRARTTLKRFAFFLVGDCVLLSAVLLIALVLRFEGEVPRSLLGVFPIAMGAALASKIPILYWQRLYSIAWSYVGMEDLIAALRGITLGCAVFSAAVLGLRALDVLPGFPRGVLVIDYALSLLLIGGFRLSRRTLDHLLRSGNHTTVGRSVLVVGAGSAGEQLVRSMLSAQNHDLVPVGLLDDDPSKVGTSLHRVPVLGPRSELVRMVQEHGVDDVFIAMPSAPSRTIRQTVEMARQAGVKHVRIVPTLDRFVEGHVTLANLREIQLEDLLGREVVSIDQGDVSAYLKGKVVLVTGAGGSIGSELCRQVMRFEPARLVVLDHEETALFDIANSLSQPELVQAVVGDVRDPANIYAVMERYRPAVVFHAAAYKHVALMERHPQEAIRTNIGGTLTVARAACRFGVEKFVLISTDKAVSPTSVMGATKRVAEEVCRALNAMDQTRFVAVRFGNVLGSRGSVVPLFQEQIRRGGPVTVRGPDVRRYFMATSEAVLLVLQAGAMGQRGEVFVLDMGEQVLIADLARELIRLSGLEPDHDIPLVFTELEPGEKEAEDMLTAEEGTVATRHERIHVANVASHGTAPHILEEVEELLDSLDSGAPGHIISCLRHLVPTYQPSALARVADGQSQPAITGASVVPDGPSG